jgi:hypothetical protein
MYNWSLFFKIFLLKKWGKLGQRENEGRDAR